jgi:hypothetical protein
MNDPKIRDRFVLDDDALRPSHDMLETAREIRVSPEEQEEAVAREKQLRQEQAARTLHEQAVAAYEAASLGRHRARRMFILHAMIFVVGNAALFAVNQATEGGAWFQWVLFGWILVLAGHAGWAFSRAEPAPPPPLPSATEAPRAASLRPPAPRPLAGRGREGANEEARARARTTQRTSRKRD